MRNWSPDTVHFRAGERALENVALRVVAALLREKADQATERALGIAGPRSDAAEQDDFGVTGRPDVMARAPAGRGRQRLVIRHTLEGSKSRLGRFGKSEQYARPF